jgi:hypothetical protein
MTHWFWFKSKLRTGLVYMTSSIGEMWWNDEEVCFIKEG